jgi:hypothetical protein
MSRLSVRKLLGAGAASSLAVALSAGLVSAAATSKTLSTNYTLVNLGTSTATVSVQYYLDNGSNWSASPSSTSFTVAGNGGQYVVAQYLDASMASGRGSAVVASDQPLGAVVQIQARNQTPTLAAYVGTSTTAATYYAPLVLRNRATAGGNVNSQIMVQNAGTSAITVQIQLVKNTASPGANYTKTSPSIAPGATYYYDLSDELASNVADNWFGSAVITAAAGGQITAIVNNFTGADQLMTYNAFPPTQLGNRWFVPQFSSRLPNGLSIPVNVQNLSGATMAANSIQMNCTALAGFTPASFTATNPSAVANNEAYSFNPVTDQTLPGNWAGSCVLTTPGNAVVISQLRQPGVNQNGAAFEAINGNGTNTRVIVPLVSKRQANGFATGIYVQNMRNTATTVNITYTPAAACTGCATFTETGISIPANGLLERNFRLATTINSMPDRWFGSATINSTDGAPIDGYVQFTIIGSTSGDTTQAHRVFTLP